MLSEFKLKSGSSVDKSIGQAGHHPAARGAKGAHHGQGLPGVRVRVPPGTPVHGVRAGQANEELQHGPGRRAEVREDLNKRYNGPLAIIPKNGGRKEEFFKKEFYSFEERKLRANCKAS